MKQAILIAAAFFVCKVEGPSMTCRPCGDQGDYCLSTYTIASRLAEFKSGEMLANWSEADLVKQMMAMDDRIDGLERKLKEKKP